MAKDKLHAWLWRQRASTRLAFLLQVGSRISSGLLGLVWSRLLLDAMGSVFFGLFLSFQRVATLGGLGDLGVGGAVALQAGRHLGRGETDELDNFLSGARAVFLVLALAAGVLFPIVAPWLPGWWRFSGLPGAEILPMIGAAAVVLMVWNSYVSNLNYACGNVAWMVAPAFVLGQLALCTHWLVAREQWPLWAQYLPYVAIILVGLACARKLTSLSHPALAAWLPMRFDRSLARSLIGRSFWVYLCGLGSLIFTAADAVLINDRFGGEAVSRYYLNYKLCELSLSVIAMTGFVSMPKITQWLASSEPAVRVRVVEEAERLSRFQTALGCAAALAYLALNDLFMRLWLPHQALAVPLWWQAAFALNLAVTAGGDTSVQLAGRCGDKGLRFAGATIGLTGLLNLGLSLLSIHADSITGVALATVVAQTILGVVTGVFICRHLGTDLFRWVLRTSLLPLGAVSLAVAVRYFLPASTYGNIIWLIAIFALLFLSLTKLLGIRAHVLVEEWKVVRAMFKL